QHGKGRGLARARAGGPAGGEPWPRHRDGAVCRLRLRAGVDRDGHAARDTRSRARNGCRDATRRRDPELRGPAGPLVVAAPLVAPFVVSGFSRTCAVRLKADTTFTTTRSVRL